MSDTSSQPEPSRAPTGTKADASLSRVLLVSGDRQMPALVRAALPDPGHELIVAGTLQIARRVLEEQHIALLLLELVLPDGDGRDLLGGLREQPGMATLPVIVIGASADANVQSECFALGADQFIERPIDAQVLGASVRGKLRRAADIRRESRYDPLTGLPNRAAFEEAYQRGLALARRNGEALSVALLDLDHFKSVNDRFGHAQGDDVLRRLAGIMGEALRRSDLLARWGGEEFVILLPDTDTVGAEHAIANVQRRVKDTRWTTPRDEEFSITFSAGIAEAAPDLPRSEVVARADYFLYLAKATGRDRIVCEHTDVETPSRRVLLAEQDELTASLVRHRLTREGFEVVHHADPEAAAHVSARPGIALAIVDVSGPDTKGLDLLARLRQRQDFRGVPIIMLTRLGSESQIVRGMELGADDYVVKPVSPVELMARVQRHMEGRGAEASPDAIALEDA